MFAHFMDQPHNIPIQDESIRLGQFLKLANAVSTGGEAKMRIQEGEVLVNGELELRRGRQLKVGDLVVLNDTAYLVGGP